ncbi:SEC-C domain-containing protein [Candidatus Pacearchaeota archaeon]|nr:SEC-C domain-containing protein [Candidatus Pacearchaeota archaeon]
MDKKKSSELRSLSRRIKGVTMPIHRKRIKWLRNWDCLCGSGIKYKKCCMNNIENLTVSDGNASIEEVSKDVQNIVNAHRESADKGSLKKDV